MSYVMKVEGGVPVGLPMARPSMVTLSTGHTTACGHWSAADLAEIAGLHPVVNGYDPAIHVANGGGTLVNGGVAAAYQARPLSELRDERITSLKAECTSRIFAVWPDHKQRSAALGVYGADQAAACARWITDHIATCDAAEAAILAAQSLDQISAALAAVTWPKTEE